MPTVKELAEALGKTIPQTVALVKNEHGVSLPNKGDAELPTELIEKLSQPAEGNDEPTASDAAGAGEGGAATDADPAEQPPADAPTDALDAEPETKDEPSAEPQVSQEKKLILALGKELMRLLYLRGDLNEINRLKAAFEGEDI